MPVIQDLVRNVEQALSFADLVPRHGEAEFSRKPQSRPYVSIRLHVFAHEMEIKDRVMLREFYQKMLDFVPYLEPAENGSLTVAIAHRRTVGQMPCSAFSIMSLRASFEMLWPEDSAYP